MFVYTIGSFSVSISLLTVLCVTMIFRNTYNNAISHFCVSYARMYGLCSIKSLSIALYTTSSKNNNNKNVFCVSLLFFVHFLLLFLFICRLWRALERHQKKTENNKKQKKNRKWKTAKPKSYVYVVVHTLNECFLFHFHFVFFVLFNCCAFSYIRRSLYYIVTAFSIITAQFRFFCYE